MSTSLRLRGEPFEELLTAEAQRPRRTRRESPIVVTSSVGLPVLGLRRTLNEFKR